MERTKSRLTKVLIAVALTVVFLLVMTAMLPINANAAGASLTGTVTISGEAEYGATLTATVVTDADSSSLKYQWYRNGSKINGKTGTTYTLDAIDVGKTITCKVTCNDLDGTIESAPTEPVKRLQLQKPAADTTAFTYTGKYLTYTLAANDNYTVSGNIQTTAGTHTVTVAINNKAIYEWTDGTRDDLTYEFVIKKASFDVSSLTFTNKTVIENGDIHNIRIEGNIPSDITVNYTEGSSAPGVYKITATFVTGGNYNDIAPMTATLTIKKAILVSDGANAIISNNNGFSGTANLSANPVEDKTAGDYGLRGYQRMAAAYKLKMTDGNKIIHDPGDMVLKLLIPESLRDKEFKLIQIYGSSVTEMDYTVEGGYAVFTPTRFGDFLFVYEETSLAWVVIALVVIIIVEFIVLDAVVVMRKLKNKKMYAMAAPSLFMLIPVGELVLAIVLAIGAIALFIANVKLIRKPKAEKAEKAASEETPVVESVVEPVDELAVESVAEPITEPAVEPVAEPEIEPVAESVAEPAVEPVAETAAEPAAEPTMEPEKENAVVFKGIDDETGLAIVARYDKSFTARLIQASDETKSYYSKIKNAILSYKKTTSRVSWNYDSINSGRTKLIKFTVRGKTLNLYLALNADDYNGTKYRLEKVESNKYADTPARYKITGERRAKYALELIAAVAEKFGLVKADDANENYIYPYESTDALVAKGLVKELITEESYEEFVHQQSLAEISKKHIDVASADEVDAIISDKVAKAAIEDHRTGKEYKGKKDIINIDTISKHFNAGDVVTLDALKEKHLIKKNVGYVKVLAHGTLDKPLTVELQNYSIEAVKMILLTGGRVERV